MSQDSSSSEAAGNASGLVFSSPLVTLAEQREQAAARARLIMSWRAHPAVVADSESWKIDTTWDELCASAACGELAWALPDQAHRLFVASQTNVGLAELPEAERKVIRDEHAKGGTRYALDPDVARWLLVEDRNETGPADLPPSDADAWRAAAEAWAAGYRARLPLELRHLGMLVLPEPGKPIVVALWIETERPAATLRSWARAVGGGADVRDDDGNLANPGRFRVLRNATACGSDWIKLEPAKAAHASVHALVARPTEATSVILRTGIAPLDALLATGGVPQRGARVVLQAPTANAKSTLNLEIAEFLAGTGLVIGWIATRDEPPESINARRLQRIGYSQADALRLVNDADALAKLNPKLAVIDGRKWYLEDVLAAGGSGPDVLFVDPLQKVRSRAGEGRGQIEAIAAALDVIESSGVTTFMTSAMVRGAGRRARIEGSFGGVVIENGATLLLDLALTDDRLRVAVLKSRYGGEGESFDLTLDRERQRLTAPPAATVADADPLVESIRKVLANDGDPVALTQAQIRVRVTGANTAIVEALKTGVSAGLWTLDGRKYRSC